ncbi:hypothetical protein [Pantoea sp. AMG 501]|uniref:hypothetical protein n=1 Tax=Pantoea sp. AMG 501 TaxID=2008894 RepID=UPI000B5A3392|nr:hypothetical protein [Pantoea sp. AMG 501]OWY74373.1 hypothetical protein CDN97_23860 [Pantoea sp. AMG 501]
MYLLKPALHVGFYHAGQLTKPLPARITGDLSALDILLRRSGWRREPDGGDPLLYYLMAEGTSWSVRTSCACCVRINCIRGHPLGTGRTEGRVLVRH